MPAGYNLPALVEAFGGRIGWRSSTGLNVNVEGRHQGASSGLFFNDFHAICTPANVAAILENPRPGGSEVNDELAHIKAGAVSRAFAAVLSDGEVLETGLDFTRYGEQNDRPVPNSGLFVGRRITPAPIPETAVNLDSVGLFFTEAKTFNLYLFQEARKAPLLVKEVTASAWEKTRVELAEVLAFLGSGHLGGAYYFGYFQDDLGTAEAIDESRIGWDGANLWRSEAIQAPKLGDLAFDRKNVAGSAHSAGLNLQFSASKDWTPVLLKRLGLFDNLVGLYAAATIIERAIYAVRINPAADALKDQLVRLGLYQELTGAAPGVPDGNKVFGLRDQIAAEVKKVRRTLNPKPRAVSYNAEGLC